MKALTVVQKRCDNQGLDLFEELNRVGLLATEPRIREIQTSTLSNMIDRFQSMEPAELLHITRLSRGNSNPATPEDMWNSVAGWLLNYLNNID